MYQIYSAILCVVFFAGKDNLKVFSVDVNDWTESSGEREVYNW